MARPRSDVLMRFESKVKILESGCHEWQSTIKGTGYGSFHHDGEAQGAHRVSYQLYKGEIPKGLIVRHKCDNRKCVNPDHLILGTQTDNVRDMDERNRRRSRGKLTEKDAAEIRKLLEQRFSQTEIAKRFGVKQTAISRIKLGKTKLFKLI